ncbi:hypothetical protein M1N21_03840 [Dehalococcoidia bacterium]|nr:hypothetical protein [Dehalococcoidia bacterium]
MSRHAEELLQFLVGRTDAYAVQQVDGSYLAIRKPLTAGLLEEHVAGRRTLGTYLVTSDGKARCGVYDFDERTDTVRQYLLWLKRWFQHWEIELGIESSGSRGYHGWIITKEFIPAFKLIKLLKLALHQLQEEVGVSIRIEVFPKQAMAQDLGNLIKLPWGIHRKSGKRTTFLGEDFKPLPDWGASFIEGLPVIGEATLDEILAEYPEEGREEAATPAQPANGKVALPCFTRMLQGVKEGFRHIASFRLAVMLYRQGMDQQLAKATLLKWDMERNQPPLGERQIGYNLRDAYSGKYKLGCPDIEAVGYCSEDCPVYRKRNGERDRRVEAPPPDTVGLRRILKLGTDPPKYEVEVDGNVLRLKHEQLFNLREFQKLYHQKFDIIPNVGMKQRDWFEYVNKLQNQMERHEAPPDAADRSRYIDLIWQWLETTTPAQSEADVEAGRPIQKNDRFYFKAGAAQEYLKTRHRLNIERSELWALIRQFGGMEKPQVLRVGKNTFRLWSLPMRVEVSEEGEILLPELENEEDIDEELKF